ncbi:protein FAR1-RELATED SEQUENCE 5-like isoform X2 [Magnolia sinica]|nr:protein FAR1-RELATED SEQUENCE 5-like isoform X2 [Magnolia sinica]
MEYGKDSSIEPTKTTLCAEDGHQILPVAKVEAINFDDVRQSVTIVGCINNVWCVQPITAIPPAINCGFDGGGEEPEMEFIPAAPDDLKPYVGKEFKSEAAATEFYTAYGAACGFSIRRNQIRKSEKTGEVIFRVLSCSREGKRGKKYLENAERKRAPKPITRVGCPATVHIRRKGEDKWVVTKFVEKHCHKLTTPTKSRFHPTHKKAINFDGIIQAVPAVKSVDALGDIQPITSMPPVTVVGVGASGEHEKEFIPVVPDDLKPHVGKEFKSEEAATEFYNAYGKICGFSIRRNQIRKSERTGQVVFRVLSCSKEGKRGKRYLENMERKRAPKPVTRVGCPAKVHIKRKGENRWLVSKFVEKHSHKLVGPIESHFLPLHRNALNEDLNVIVSINEVGVDAGKAPDFHANESGEHGEVVCLDGDVENSLRKKSIQSYEKDAHAIYEYFKQNRIDDPSFYYQTQIDKNCRVTSCFWVDGGSQLDYQVFGDVICFDTTYKTNQYDVSFVPFIGMNHRKQPILVGAGLLFDETIENLKWLFQTWLKAMGGKHPKAIITDQDRIIKAAIADVFPDIQHRFSMWHILHKIPERLGHLYYEGSTFKHDFDKCIHQSDTVEEFEALWKRMVKEYKLEDVEWLRQIYRIRDMWVPVYSKNVFLAGMSTAQQVESINSLFKEHVDHDSMPIEFILGYQKALYDQRHKESEADAQMAYDLPMPRTSFPMDTELGSIYTREIFSDVQEELFQSPPYNANLVEKNGAISTYEVTHMSIKGKVYNVLFDEEEQAVTCRCLLFEREGIVCRHSLAVFRTLCIDKMPARYILKRWTRHAKVGLSLTNKPLPMAAGELPPFVRRDDLRLCWKRFSKAALKSLRVYDFAKDRISDLIEEVEGMNKEEHIIMGQNDSPIEKIGSNEVACLDQAGTNGRSGLAPSPKSVVLHDENIIQAEGHDASKRIKFGKEADGIYAGMCPTCWGQNHDSQMCPLVIERGQG